MKRKYVTPKAEKMEFDYSEVVVASGCYGGIYEQWNLKGEENGCHGEDVWVGGYGVNDH